MDLSKSVRHGLAHVNRPRSWLAENLGVTPQYIGQVCNGKREPNMDRVRSMCQLFGVSVSEFIKWGEM